jgi:hypothetical protein
VTAVVVAYSEAASEASAVPEEAPSSMLTVLFAMIGVDSSSQALGSVDLGIQGRRTESCVLAVAVGNHVVAAANIAQAQLVEDIAALLAGEDTASSFAATTTIALLEFVGFQLRIAMKCATVVR